MAGVMLIGYASKYGATQEIAEKIGEVLKKDGISVDVLPLKKVKNLTDYKDVIIGSAMYMGMWLREGASFLQQNASQLAERRVWIFASGPPGKGNPVELLKGMILPLNVKQSIEQIKPRDTAIFHGCLNEKKMNFMEKWVIKRVGSSFGDFRDWEMINAWAKKVAEEIKK